MRRARYSALAAPVLLAIAVGGVTGCGGEDAEEPAPCPLTPEACANADVVAPDPGGDENASVPVPPRGIRFGFNDSPQVEGLEPAALEGLGASVGANARRFPLDWRQLEPQRDVWNDGGWDYYHAAYDAIIATGMTPVMNFGFAPPWARAAGEPQACQDFFDCRYPPAPQMDEEWREFATEVARRFPGAVLEVWNEPNLGIFWRPAPDPERFAELLAIAYDAIKAVRQSTVVLAGGLAAIQEPGSRVAAATPADIPLREFLDRAYSAEPSIRTKMDALSFHPYPYNGDLGARSVFAKSFADVREVAADHGDTTRRRLFVNRRSVTSAV